MPKLLPTVCSLVLAAVLPAQTPHLLADINQEASAQTRLSSLAVPRHIGLGESGLLFRGSPVLAGGWSYFVVDEPEAGAELWRSLGTSRTTERVSDLWPGELGSEPRELRAMGARVLFVAGDPVHGRELRISDGTSAGTHLVVDLSPGAASSDIRNLISWSGGVAFCLHDEGAGTCSLWISDGTKPGTKLVYRSSQGAHALGGLAWNPHRSEIWLVEVPNASRARILVSKGSSAKALTGQNVALMREHSSRSFAFSATHAFYADDGLGEKRRLCSYEYKTMREQTLPGTGWPRLGRAAMLGSELVYAASKGSYLGELWISDGSATGTRMLTQFPGDAQDAGRDPSLGAWPTWQGRLVFPVGGPTLPRAELWSTDGTAKGTRPLAPSFVRSGPIFELHVSGGELYVACSSAGLPRRLWRYRSAGWSKLHEQSYGSTAVSHSCLGEDKDGKLLFSWSEWASAAQTRPGALELLQYDPVSDQVQRLRAWQHPVCNGSSHPNELTALRTRLFFVADDGKSGRGIWCWDSTTRKATRVVGVGLDANSAPTRLTVAGGRLFFVARHSSLGRELFVWDEATERARLVRNIGPGAQDGIDSATSSFVVFRGELHFAADDGMHGRELWASDGTGSGTRMLCDLSPGAATGTRFEAAVGLDDHVVFLGRDRTAGDGLWSYSRASRTASKLLSLPRDWSRAGLDAVRVVGEAYFAIPYGGRHTDRILRSDGANAWTTMENASWRILTDPSVSRTFEVLGGLPPYFLVQDTRYGQVLIRQPMNGGWPVPRQSSAFGLRLQGGKGSVGLLIDRLSGGVRENLGRFDGYFGITPYFETPPGHKKPGPIHHVRRLGGGRDVLFTDSGLYVKKLTQRESQYIGYSAAQSVPNAAIRPAPAYVSGRLVFASDDGRGRGVELWSLPVLGGSHSTGEPSGPWHISLPPTDCVLGSRLWISPFSRTLSGWYLQMNFIGSEARQRSPVAAHCLAAFDPFGFFVQTYAVYVNSMAAVSFGLPIPNQKALIGQRFVSQVVTVDGRGRLSLSNGLLLVPGPGS